MMLAGPLCSTRLGGLVADLTAEEIDEARSTARWALQFDCDTSMTKLLARAVLALTGQQATPVRIRCTDGVVAIYRPHPIVHPWHCYNTKTGEFIEARTNRQVARYHELPTASKPRKDNDV